MKFCIHTYGCQMNVRESDAVAASLAARGHEQTLEEDEADLVIVNTCSVREKAEEKAIGKLGILCASKRERPFRIIGVMGCMAQRIGKDLFGRIKALDFAVGARSMGDIAQIVDEISKERHSVWREGRPDSPSVPQGHCREGFSDYVTVLLGCNRRCSYCIVPDVRGPEYSRPAPDIIGEIGEIAARGIKEVTLLGQSVFRYGRQAGFSMEGLSGGSFTEPFPALLEKISGIDGIERIRFTSGHPSGCTEELARAFRDLGKVCRHLHLPVQSGSDRILKLMRRGYTAEEYLDSVERLRSRVPDIALTTDVIVGFPTESREDFEKTKRLMEKARFDNSFIFKYSPRPGTPSAGMEDDVSAEEKDSRNKELLALQDEMAQKANAAWVGKAVDVLVEGPSLRNPDKWSGRSSQNKIVVFDPAPGIEKGMMAKIKVVRARPQTLFGEYQN